VFFFLPPLGKISLKPLTEEPNKNQVLAHTLEYGGGIS